MQLESWKKPGELFEAAMKAEQWKKVEELFEAAQAQPADARAAFLDRACPGDPELRGEVESLLRAADSAGSLLRWPPVKPKDQPALKAGDKLGVFEIVECIGRGGMGEVYRARDPRLGRDVAIKVLPPEFARDIERLRRFEYEARAASALNHPNIVSVHDIGSADGLSWMVTELVEGRPLRDALAKGALTLRKVVEIAAQIADGLAAAHAAGIVHRDLKPENVMLTASDLVKILDFGIAKWRPPGATGALTGSLTKTGEVVGTVAGMSPEQVLGKDVDHRSDIFSLGTLLYEMLSGRQPFKGDNRLTVMNAIVTKEPEDLPAAVPEALAGIVRRCLEKLPERRFQSAADLGFALRMAVAAPPGHLTPDAPRAARLWLRKVLAAGLTILLLAATGLWLRSRNARAPFQQIKAERLTGTGDTLEAAISPDGKYVARVAGRGELLSVWLRQLGTASEVPVVAAAPVWIGGLRFSRDGEYLYYSQSKGTERSSLYKVPSLGGTPELVLEGARGPVAISPDERRFAWVSGGTDQSFSILVAGRDPADRKTILTRKAPEFLRDHVSWSPDGKLLAVGIGSSEERSWQIEKLLIVPVNAAGPTLLAPMKWNRVDSGEWLSNGRGMLVNADFQVWFIPHPGGAPKRVTHELNTSVGVSVTADSTALVTVQIDQLGEMWTTTPHARTASQLTQTSARGDGFAGIGWTPDGRLIYTSSPTGSLDLWLANADGSNAKRLTFGGVAIHPQAAPDGKTIYFGTERDSACHLWRMDMDGSNAAQVTHGGGEQTAALSPDGKWLFYESFRIGGDSSIWKMALPSGTPVRLGDLKNSVAPSASPDGQWLAVGYSDGRFQPADGVGIMRLDGTGFRPLSIPMTRYKGWSPDGKSLYVVKNEQGIDNIWKQPIPAGTAARVTNFTSGRIAWLAVSRDERLAFRHAIANLDAVLIRSVR